MDMTVSSDFELNCAIVNKFGVKFCNLPDFGPSSDSSSQMKLFRKNHVRPHLHKWNGLFSGCNADELVCLVDAMQMNLQVCLHRLSIKTTRRNTLNYWTPKYDIQNVLVQERSAGGRYDIGIYIISINTLTI